MCIRDRLYASRKPMTNSCSMNIVTLAPIINIINSNYHNKHPARPQHMLSSNEPPEVILVVRPREPGFIRYLASLVKGGQRGVHSLHPELASSLHGRIYLVDLRVPDHVPYGGGGYHLSLIHISEPTRLGMISYAVFCLKKKKKQ